MKIQSSFDDFYDYASYYLGEDTYYRRETNNRQLHTACGSSFYKDNPCLNIDLLDKIFKKYGIRLDDYHFRIKRDQIYNAPTILIIGEKIIPFFIHTIATYIAKNDAFTLQYAIADAHQLSKKEQTWLSNNFIDLYKALREICKEPIILFSSIKSIDSIHDRHKLRFGTTVNPQLKQIKGIQSLISAEQVIQELELYINKEDNTIHITSDDIKRDSAGFDKHSFKHNKDQYENQKSSSTN